ncbi:MAG: hypothetical protein WC775_03970 [Patescibacteria group bacterium]|jgi:hypothetical protein
MQKEGISNKTVYFEWEAPVRHFEQKTQSYFRAIIALGVLLTLALYFLGEYLLILVVWSVVFVFYVKAAIPPQNALYKLTKFGIQFYQHTIPYEVLRGFTVVHKSTNTLLRIFVSEENSYEMHILLPQGDEEEKILAFLEEKVPFIEHIPKTNIERFSSWVGSFLGLS